MGQGKKCRYLCPVDCKSENHDPMHMEYIRNQYGSETIPVE